MAAAPLRKLIQVLPNGKLYWNQRSYRQLILLSTWTGFFYIEKYIFADTIDHWTACPNLLYQWIKLLIAGYNEENEKLSVQRAMNLTFQPPRIVPNLPEPHDIARQLSIICDGSPKLRSMMRVISELVILQQKKLIVFCSIPANQLLVYAVLQALRVSALLYTSNLSIEDRAAAVLKFTQKPNEAMVFIASYFVGSTGLNLYPLCYHILLFDSAHNEGAQRQALGRAQRIGQTETVEVFEINNVNTFQNRIIRNSIEKALPGTIAELDIDISLKPPSKSTGLQKEDSQLDIGTWFVVDDELVQAPDPRVDSLPAEQALSPEQLVRFLLRTKRGEPSDVDDEWKEEENEEQEEDDEWEEEIVTADVLMMF